MISLFCIGEEDSELSIDNSFNVNVCLRHKQTEKLRIPC